MRKKEHHKTTKILTYKQYRTFQGYYRIKSALDKGLGLKDVFNKSILHVMDWLKYRLEGAETTRPDELNFLSHYPSPDKYVDFELFTGEDNYISIEANTDYDISLFAVKEENAWTLRLLEPNNDSENTNKAKPSEDENTSGESSSAPPRERHPERIFITNISVKQTENDVKLAVRITCREPNINREDCAAYRPAFLYMIYEDEDLLLTEGNIESSDYPINGDEIVLNTKSGEECTKFCHELLLNEERQLPIVLAPSQFTDDKQIGQLASDTAASAYLIIENDKKKFAKLFSKLKSENKLTEAEFTEYKNRLDKEFLCFNPIKDGNRYWFSMEEEDWKKKLVALLRSYTVRRDEEGKKPAPITYGDLLFRTALLDKYVREIEDASNRELLEDIKKQQEETMKKMESFVSEDEMRKLLEESAALLDRIKLLEESNRKYSSENTTYKQLIDEKNEEINNQRAQIEKNKTEIRSLESRLPSKEQQEDALRREEVKCEACRYMDKYRDRPKKKNEVLQWIKDNFSEHILLHGDAEKAYKKYSDALMELDRFCLAFVLLNACVMNKNGEMPDDVYTAIREKPELSVLEPDTPTGFDSSVAPPAAFINYLGKKCLLDRHLKYSADSSETFRIYYLFCSTENKAVIGSMPDHLSQTKNKDERFSSRINKA